jgi:hypothetical protein
MSGINPYAPSKASMAPRSSPAAVDSETKVWRDGKTVVTRHDASLPARCVKCNAPADQPTKVRTLYWMNPFIYLLFLINALILIIVYFIVRKKAEVDPGLCERHKKRRLYAITYGWLAFLAGLALIFIGLGGDQPLVAVLGVLLLISALVAAMTFGRIIYAKKITKDEVRLGGFAVAYLDELPDYPG